MFSDNFEFNPSSPSTIQISVSNLDQRPQTFFLRSKLFHQNFTEASFFSKKISFITMMDTDVIDKKIIDIMVQTLYKGNLSVTAFKYDIYLDNILIIDKFHVIPTVYLPGKYEFYIMCLPPERKSTVMKDIFVIVAPENNTEITLTLAHNATLQLEFNVLKDTPHTLTLNQEETLSAFSEGSLIGSHIISNKPISLFSGHKYRSGEHNQYNVHETVEQIPPTSTWGTEFYVAPHRLHKSLSHVAISSRNNNILRILCNGKYNNVTIQKGAYFSFLADNFCHIKSTHPILLALVSPFIAVVPPVKQYRNTYAVDYFNVQSSQQRHFLNIIFLKSDDSDERIDLLLNGHKNLSNKANWTEIQCIHNLRKICAYGFDLELDKMETIFVSHPNPHARFSVLSYSYEITYEAIQGSYSGMTQIPIACKLNREDEKNV